MMKKLLLCVLSFFLLTSCGNSKPAANLSDLSPEMQSAYRDKINEKAGENSANRSYALYDICGDGVPDLFVGWSRNLAVYKFENGTLIHLGDIYNEPFAPQSGTGVYTYGGFGTGTGGSLFFQIRDNSLSREDGEVNLQYLVSQGERTFMKNGESVSEDEYNNTVDFHFNDETRIPLQDIQ